MIKGIQIVTDGLVYAIDVGDEVSYTTPLFPIRDLATNKADAQIIRLITCASAHSMG